MPNDNQSNQNQNPPNFFPQDDNTSVIPPKEPQEEDKKAPEEFVATQTSDTPPSNLPPPVSPQPKKRWGKRALIGSILALMVLVFGLVAGLVLIPRQQEIREKASTQPDQYTVTKSISPQQLVCGEEAQINIQVTRVGGPVEVPVDLSLVLDRSGSMDDLGGHPPEPIHSTKEAAKFLVDTLDVNDSSDGDKISLSSYNQTATLNLPLSGNAAQIKQSIDAFTTDGFTNVEAGIITGATELSQNARAQAKKVIVLLSDGLPNRNNNGDNCETWPTSSNTCTQAAVTAAASAKNQGVIIYTIGLDFDGIDAEHPGTGSFGRQFMSEVATSPDHFFDAPSHEDLAAVFEQIGIEVNDVVVSTTLTEAVNSSLNIVSGSINPAPTSVTGNTIQWDWNTMAIGEKQNFSFRVTGNTPSNNLAVNLPESILSYLEYDGASRNIPLPTDVFLTVNQGGTCLPEEAACKEVKILRGGVEIQKTDIKLGDIIVFRGFAANNTQVAKFKFTLTKGGVAQTPVEIAASLVGNQYQADYQVTISEAASYSIKVEPVIP